MGKQRFDTMLSYYIYSGSTNQSNFVDVSRGHHSRKIICNTGEQYSKEVLTSPVMSLLL